MLEYVIRRTVAIVLMLLAISIITFLLFFAIPRDPARLTCGKNCTPALLKIIGSSSEWPGRQLFHRVIYVRRRALDPAD